MRLKLLFELENKRIDIQYRKAILSWIKKSLQEYDEELYEQLYKDKNPIKKSFCFAPILANPKFSQEEIQLSDTTLQIIFSFYNYAYALHLYNAFNSQKEKVFSLHQNSMTLKQINMLPEKQITSEKITIKTISPIICRNHNQETKKDMYYYAEREEFQTYIRINISEQMKAEGLEESLLEGFSITPVQTKKVIVKLYEKKIETTIGTLELEGNKKILDYLYKAGLGSKKAMGFRSI